MVGNTTNQSLPPEPAPPVLTPSGQPLLKISNISVQFGGIAALNNVSFDVPHGQIIGVIGPNGAGKTTLFNCIDRLCAPISGEIFFNNLALSNVARHKIVSLGIGRTFQNVALFKTLTVRENLLVGAHIFGTSGFIASSLRWSRAVSEERNIGEIADQLLNVLELTHVAERVVGELPFGTLKRVEFGRALASKPKLLLLDEPAAGLIHQEVETLGKLIVAVRARFNTTILLVEHQMAMVMSICDKIVVLNSGQKLAEGRPEEIRKNPDVINAYLGRRT